jgi:hypothetical protein
MIESQAIKERTHKVGGKLKNQPSLYKSRDAFHLDQSLVHAALNAAAAVAFENGEEINIRLQNKLITLLPDGTYTKEDQPRRQNANRIIELP